MQSRRRSRLPARATSQRVVHPVPQRPRPVGGQQRAAHRASTASTTTPTPAPSRRRPSRPARHRGDRGQRQRPRPAPAGRGRAVPAQRAGHRVGVCDQLGQHRLGRRRGARRQQQRRLARARRRPSSPRPAGRRRTAGPAAAPAACRRAACACRTCARALRSSPCSRCRTSASRRKHQVAVRHQRPQHRQHHRRDQHDDRDDDGDARDHAEPLRGIAARIRRAANAPVPHRVPPGRPRRRRRAIMASPVKLSGL